MCQFHLNMNVEGRFCRHSLTSSVTSSAWEIFSRHNLHMVYPYPMSNWSYIEQVKFLKSEETLGSGRTFASKVSSEGSYVKRIAMSIPCTLSFWWRSSSKIDGVMAIWKFDLFFLPGNLVPWSTSFSMLLAGTSDWMHKWTDFGDHMSKRSWVMLDKTDILTDKRTNEHTWQNVGK